MALNVLSIEPDTDLAISRQVIYQTAPSASSAQEVYPIEPLLLDANRLKSWLRETSYTASGLDGDLILRTSLWESDLWTTRPYYAEIREELTRIRPENRRAIELLDAWMSEPDDLGPEWWAEFDRELAASRLSFRGER